MSGEEWHYATAQAAAKGLVVRELVPDGQAFVIEHDDFASLLF